MLPSIIEVAEDYTENNDEYYGSIDAKHECISPVGDTLTFKVFRIACWKLCRLLIVLIAVVETVLVRKLVCKAIRSTCVHCVSVL